VQSAGLNTSEPGCCVQALMVLGLDSLVDFVGMLMTLAVRCKLVDTSLLSYGVLQWWRLWWL